MRESPDPRAPHRPEVYHLPACRRGLSPVTSQTRMSPSDGITERAIMPRRMSKRSRIYAAQGAHSARNRSAGESAGNPTRDFADRPLIGSPDGAIPTRRPYGLSTHPLNDPAPWIRARSLRRCTPSTATRRSGRPSHARRGLDKTCLRGRGPRGALRGDGGQRLSQGGQRTAQRSRGSGDRRPAEPRCPSGPPDRVPVVAVVVPVAIGHGHPLLDAEQRGRPGPKRQRPADRA